MIWAAAIGAFVGTVVGVAIGVFIMCLCNVAADGGQDRAFASERRALELSIALRRLLAAVQGYVESGDGMQELAVAMSNAAEVLTQKREQ